MGAMTANASQYWLDQFTAEVVDQHPTGEILVSSGISPSASYHIGHFREALTADAIAWSLRQRGRQAKHVHIVDNFDPLRKRYHFLPERFEQFVGWPICLVPDPFDCHSSYAQHYAAEFKAAAAQMGVEMEVIHSYEEFYVTGKMAPYIEQAMAGLDNIRHIFAEVSQRELAPDWVPLQILSDAKNFNEWRFESIDTKTKTLEYRDSHGKIGSMRYDDGRVKLNWRLDWPARWALLGVDVEPYGKEHATKGGSYDTGARFVQEVFAAKAPTPLPYDTINMVGDTKKMSSSLGNLVTPAQALEIMPAEILRYFILKSLPKRVVYFDPGIGLYNLVDEYAKLEEAVQAGHHPEFEQAYQVAAAHAGERVISSIPFNHLVSVYQAARSDIHEVQAILERGGYAEQVKREWPVIKRELAFVAHWLANHAPDSVKFAIQEELPKLNLSTHQQTFLARLADTIAVEHNLNGQGMHDAIYAASVSAELKPAQAFLTLYQVILGQDKGPKAGWFLATLDQNWLVLRLQTAAAIR